MQVLPRQYTDARTYNMLISVCVRAKDLTQALHAADMLESTGRKLDTILYTNLIGGVLLNLLHDMSTCCGDLWGSRLLLHA